MIDGLGVQSQLQANNLTLTTSNGPIIGHFFSDSSLVLKTSNGVILADVELLNKKSASRRTFASLVTSNAYVSHKSPLQIISNSSLPERKQ